MFRKQSATQGRWISPDPAGLAAVDPTNPQSWNRYAYVMNNPLSFVDPLGLCDPNDPSCIHVDVNGCPSGSSWQNGQCWTGACLNGVGTIMVQGMMICGTSAMLQWIYYQISQYQQCASGGCQGGNSGGSGGSGPGGPKPAPPKSPARQQCEKNALQKYSNMRASIPGIAVRGAEVFAVGTIMLQAAAGCALGGGAGGILGGLATSFLGGEGAFAGAAVGCPTGAVSAVLDGLPMTAAVAVVGGGGTYAVERIVASQELTADLQACSQIP